MTRPSNMHVFYSKSEDNPYLPKGYVDNLRAGMSKLEADVKLRGLWRDIAGKGVYHSYEKAQNFVKMTYKVDYKEPVWLSWDFNIGDGKPLSAVSFQVIKDNDRISIHYFDEVVVDGMRTQDSCEEWIQKPWFCDRRLELRITGDRNGSNRDTRNNRSDYEIISRYFENFKIGNEPLRFDKSNLRLLRSNPPVRSRHNLINSLCCNDFGQVNLYVYQDAPTADKALRLTKLKKGATIIEDDTDRFQHIGTAMGYGAWKSIRIDSKKKITGTHQQ